MLKSILFFLSILILSLSSYSQDLIITNAGDTLNCKITKVTEKSIFFDYKAGDQWRSTLIQRSRVESFSALNDSIKDVSKEEVLSNSSSQFPPKREYDYSVNESVYENNKASKLPKYTRLFVEGGLSNYTRSTPGALSQEYQDHYSDLKAGYYIGIDLSHFGEEKIIGYGIAYQNSFSNKSSDFQLYLPPPDDIEISYTQNDKVITQSILASLKSRLPIDKRGSYIYLGMFGGVGVLKQSVSTSSLSPELNQKGSVQGLGPSLGAEIGGDIHLTSLLKLCVNAAYLRNRISELTPRGSLTLLNSEESNHNDRMNIGVGLAFYFE